MSTGRAPKKTASQRRAEARAEGRRGCVYIVAIVLVVGGLVLWGPTVLRNLWPAGSPEDANGIPGLTAADIRLNLEDRGFTCEGPGSSASYACTSGPHRVMFFGDSVTTISTVSASTVADHTFALEFLGYIATLPYDGAEPAKARQWVADNIATGGTTSIGGATFTLSASGQTLTIRGD